MTTFAQVRDLILGDLHRSDLTAQVETALGNAVTQVRMERFWFNEVQTSFTVTLTADYAMTTVLPTLLEIDTMRVWYNGSPSALTREHWDTLADRDETLVTGLPSSWAVHHEMLRLHPTPDQTLMVEVSGLKELSASAWCSYAPMLMRSLAQVEVCTLVLHDDAHAQRAAQMAQIERGALRRRKTTAAASGQVRPYL